MIKSRCIITTTFTSHCECGRELPLCIGVQLTNFDVNEMYSLIVQSDLRTHGLFMLTCRCGKTFVATVDR